MGLKCHWKCQIYYVGDSMCYLYSYIDKRLHQVPRIMRWITDVIVKHFYFNREKSPQRQEIYLWNIVFIYLVKLINVFIFKTCKQSHQGENESCSGVAPVNDIVARLTTFFTYTGVCRCLRYTASTCNIWPKHLQIIHIIAYFRCFCNHQNIHGMFGCISGINETLPSRANSGLCLLV